MAARRKTADGALAYVARSPIHGRGLFAARRIPKDTMILEVEGVPTRREGAYTLWVDGKDGLRVTNDVRFVNHARPSNAALYADELWSIRAIEKDEEITHDYGAGWEE